MHIDDVKLLYPQTNSVLPQLWRTTNGDFDIAAGKAEYGCYFQLAKQPSENDVVDVYVRRAEETRRGKATWTALNMTVPAGLRRIDVREPDPGQQAGPSSTGKHAKKDGKSDQSG